MPYLVSVIVPTYNRKEFIVEALDSVLNQTYKNYEVLVVDDGSTDGTYEYIAQYFMDDRFFYFRQENQGQSVARNKALAEAKGDFICFLDSDNVWMPDKLENQLTIMSSHPDYDVVYGDGITINEAGEEISRSNMHRYSGYIAKQMLKDNCVSMNTVMARRRCFDELGGMSGKRRVADDYDLWLRFSTKYKFLYVPEYFIKYRVMEDQISSDKNRRFETNEQIIHDFLKEYPNAVTPREAREGLSAFYARKARYCARSGDSNAAWTAIGRALRYNPAGQVCWRGLFRVLFPK